jgi:hypothetical protein
VQAPLAKPRRRSALMTTFSDLAKRACAEFPSWKADSAQPVPVPCGRRRRHALSLSSGLCAPPRPDWLVSKHAGIPRARGWWHAKSRTAACVAPLLWRLAFYPHAAPLLTPSPNLRCIPLCWRWACRAVLAELSDFEALARNGGVGDLLASVAARAKTRYAQRVGNALTEQRPADAARVLGRGAAAINDYTCTPLSWTASAWTDRCTRAAS